MAEHNEVAYTTADGNDYPAHEQTYEGFIMLVKYGTARRHLHRRHDGDLPDLIAATAAPPPGGAIRKIARDPVAKPVSISAGETLVCARARFAPPEAS